MKSAKPTQVVNGSKRLTVAQKEEILEMLANDIPRHKIIKEMDIGVDTYERLRKNNELTINARKNEIRKKVKAKFTKIYDEEATGLAERMVEKGHLILDAITPKKLENASLSQLGVTFGILTDKMRLLTGQSTDNLAVKFIDKNTALAYLRQDRKAIDV